MRSVDDPELFLSTFPLTVRYRRRSLFLRQNSPSWQKCGEESAEWKLAKELLDEEAMMIHEERSLPEERPSLENRMRSA